MTQISPEIAPAAPPGSHPGTLTALLRLRAATLPDVAPHVYVLDDQHLIAVTHAQLDQRAQAVAAALRGLAAPGDRVLLAYDTGPDFADAFFGCLYAGVLPVPVPPPAGGALSERFEAVALDCDPRLVLTTSGLAPLVEGALATDQLPDLPFEPLPADPEAVAYLQYTAGTTGAPRGVAITHGGAFANLAQITELSGAGPHDRMVAWLPLFHDMGLGAQLLMPMYAGYDCWMMQPLAFVRRPQEWLRLLSDLGATCTATPGFGLRMALRKTTPEQRAGLDLSGLRVVLVGAEPLYADDLDRFLAATGISPDALFPSYGLAEGAFMVSGGGRAVLEADTAALAWGRLAPGRGRRVRGSGRVLPGTTVQIADPVTGRPLEPGEIGEIVIDGPAVTPGYWNEPPRHGPLPTGDLGAFHDGELYVLGRVEDSFLRDGRVHHAHDVERTIAEVCGDHVRAAVFAGEHQVVAVVEMADGPDPAPAVWERHGLELKVVTVKRGGVPVTTSGKPRRDAARAAVR
ncbi:AMP-binding protein [Nonomuraea sp. NPDC050310]|uniref:AMP-binding protein n=1 Tax=Nonomuraea sp. NPDC050310 TaxID=3154935 RepID=UPI0033E736A0